MTFVPLHDELAALTTAHRRDAIARAARRTAHTGVPPDAPAFALAYRFGMLGDSLATSPLAPRWLDAARDLSAFHALVAPVFALGLLALPRDDRSGVLRGAPDGLEPATRSAFLAIRELPRPDADVLATASSVWRALSQLRTTPSSPRVLAVSALLVALAPALPYELDALSDGPPFVLPCAKTCAAGALAAWWLANLAGEAS